MIHKKTLFIPFTILLLVATVQLALVSRMVAVLHIQKTEVGTYHILASNGSANATATGEGGFDIHVLPAKLSLNQGHVTNGAAGYGVVMSIAALVACIFLRRDAYQKNHKSILLTLTTAVFLLVLFQLAALTYVFAVTYLTINNTIDIDTAQALSTAAGAGPVPPYSIDNWTPETWYKAVLLLPLDASTQSRLSSAASEMVAWRSWIVFYVVVGMVVMVWTAMAYLREWKRICGCRLGFGTAIPAEEEELVSYRFGYHGAERK